MPRRDLIQAFLGWDPDFNRRVPKAVRMRLALSGLLAGMGIGGLVGQAVKGVGESRWPIPIVFALIALGGFISIVTVLRRQLLERANLERDQQAARQIQTRLRPESLPQPAGFELAEHYRAFSHIGGDYYDAFMLDERRMLLLIADVSGKGAAAALLTANLQAILRFSQVDSASLTSVARAINVHLCRHTEPDRFITLMIGVLDVETRTLTYVNAGHNPAIVTRGGQVLRLEATGPPLGMIEEIPIVAAETTLERGDALVLYTDGLTERRNRGGSFFDEDGVVKTLARNGNAQARAIVDSLVSDSEAFAEGEPPGDDTAIVVLRAR